VANLTPTTAAFLLQLEKKMKKESSSKWTTDEIDYIKSCFKDGKRSKTNRMISMRLNRPISEVKNIVKRLKLAEGIENPLQSPKKEKAVGISFDDIKHNQCRAIISDDGEPCVFCGKKTVTGTSYCEEHKKKYFISVQRRKTMALIPASVS